MNNANETVPRSMTAADVFEGEGNTEMEKGNLIGSKKSIERLVHIREYHLTNAPYSLPIDVAHAHRKAANVLNLIIYQLNDANGALTAKYEIESENHITRATELS
mmetsp:Transcript_15293/g.18113  ORF Transcript_15293/g.18113 Transcript_15293/m.18113 type:complete len:105 (-) Transcript_15293:446-760(-)|eukprot:CAMPEP_0198251780 /NCGR_PEP_ID=MMETSP1447-20131203/2508_1 /TAXON_ID=420782 /ORGANISM="Chaetoceros dichaeta, Strain CCMP1751" /LENGTH=104 /DNA_ID=CAMNT_0043936881 /DNA_START=47 /DNA_END=361 /DNA_ORIENTATION=-